MVQKPTLADPGPLGHRRQGERLHTVVGQQALRGIKQLIPFHTLYYTVRTVKPQIPPETPTRRKPTPIPASAPDHPVTAVEASVSVVGIRPAAGHV
ncbi:hypothetical protein Aph01nite_31670 [Acrocarpospora phusangensis]|uniref:Uncharacterized protein n=1 Tax=Acrocarpospora phusangensis TaxID=1070424 RepID=A0A919UNS9_9ACTN|nr:hypothetical protein Aph01nite_31670 [Acrocarpospora phusangensis]